MTDEAVLTRNPIYSTLPVVEIDGRTDEMVQTLLVAMEVTESEQGLSALEMRFDNSATIHSRGNAYAFEYGDNDQLSLGKSITVRAGDRRDPRELFQGTISGLEMIIAQQAQPLLVVLAEDALQKARLTRRTRLHGAGRVSDIAAAIAADLGLTPRISGLDQQVDDQLQLNQSDLAFLRQLVSRFDGQMRVAGNDLIASPRSDVRRNEFTLEIGSQLLSVRALADLSHQVHRVTYAGFDVPAGQEIQAESNGAADLGPGRGRTGAQWMTQAFGERSEHLSRACAHNQAEAQALVNAAYSERARKFVHAEAEAMGNPDIRVGSHVTFAGLGPRFDNTYFVTRTQHRFDLVNGYRTRFHAECAYLVSVNK